jgi:isopropylmalate/homocitrate/citramalate synthase
MRQLVPTPFSAHLHNDFGLALPNALTALSAGAAHICTTINGWGERAGNLPLEQLVMTLQILYNKNLGIDTTQLRTLSELIAEYTHIPLPRSHPFVGDNIFSHESGIHVAAILENPQTYEPIPPALVGNKRTLVLGKHSGKHLIQQIIKDHGITIESHILTDIVSKVKQLGEQNGQLTENDLLKLIQHYQVENSL